MGLGCGTTLVKYILFVFNFLIAVSTVEFTFSSSTVSCLVIKITPKEVSDEMRCMKTEIGAHPRLNKEQTDSHMNSRGNTP